MIRFYKVRWSRHFEKEATWETEEFLRSKYLEFLLSAVMCVYLFCRLLCAYNLRVRVPLRERVVTPHCQIHLISC
jgi:hypothetical protein